MSNVQHWVRDMTESVIGGPPFAVGDTVKHPDGRTVKIIAGRYWGLRGISNWWYWREVLPDGTLSANREHGYGWTVD